MKSLTFYCGINEKNWNHHPVAPGPHACVAPVYGSKESTRRNNSVTVPAGVEVIQDSGAFSDGPSSRLTFEKALERQVKHAERYGYATQITHRASYDLLIDEKWSDGSRSKRRWSEDDAWSAVDETVRAAEYLAVHRGNVGLIQSAQGVTPQQYLECTKRVVPFINPERDLFGLGGWCITGKFPAQMMPVFRDTVQLIMPYISKAGIQRVHVWGVLHAPALAELLFQADKFGIAVSTDSSGPSTRPVFGSWGYADWTDLNYMDKWKFYPEPAVTGDPEVDALLQLAQALSKNRYGVPKPPPVEIRGLERARHVQAVRDWLTRFRETRYYRALSDPKIVQLSLFEVAA